MAANYADMRYSVLVLNPQQEDYLAIYLGNARNSAPHWLRTVRLPGSIEGHCPVGMLCPIAV